MPSEWGWALEYKLYYRGLFPKGGKQMFNPQVLTIGLGLILLIYFAVRGFQSRLQREIVAGNSTVVGYVVMLTVIVTACLRTNW
jgi:hypothetical protein